jgi:hypothetical protein
MSKLDPYPKKTEHTIRHNITQIRIGETRVNERHIRQEEARTNKMIDLDKYNELRALDLKVKQNKT